MSGGHVLHSCNAEQCNICDGGLAYCTVCGGAEGAMPTECPGVHMAVELTDQVYRGEFNFVGGQWVNKMALDISKLPPGCDWIIGYTNGGLTIHAQVGPLKECFGDTPQEALDAAIARWMESQKPADDGLLV